MPIRFVVDGVIVTAYLDAPGVDAVIERLELLRAGERHIHLTDLLDVSPVSSGRQVATDVDIVLVTD